MLGVLERAEAWSGLEEDGIGWGEGRMVLTDEITSLMKGVNGGLWEMGKRNLAVMEKKIGEKIKVVVILLF